MEDRFNPEWPGQGLPSPDGSRSAGSESAQQDPLPSDSAAPLPSSGELRRDIEQRLGFFPPFLLPALDQPEVLRSIWNRTRRDYLDLPLPGLFKEELQVLLARYCPVSYAIVYHTTVLRRMGMTGGEVLEFVDLPVPGGEAELAPYLESLEAEPTPWTSWPEPMSLLEKALLVCAVFLFSKPGRSPRAQQAIRRLLGPEREIYLTSFLSYVKSYHLWVETYPEPTIESVPQIWREFVRILQEEPRLAREFRSYRERAGNDSEETSGAASGENAELELRASRVSVELAKAMEALRAEVPKRTQVERELAASQERFNQLFASTQDPVYTFDLSGTLTSLNRAAELLTGYTGEEAKQLNLAQLVAPEFLEVARRMLDPEACTAQPFTCEFTIVTKENGRVAVQTSQRLTFSERKGAEFLAVARRIPESAPAAAEEPGTSSPSLPSGEREEMDALRQLDEALQARIAAQDEGERLRGLLEGAERQVQEQAEALATVQRLLNTESAARASERDALQRRIGESETRLAEALELEQSLQARIEEHRQEAQTLRRTLDESEARCADQKRTIEGLEAQASEQGRTIETLQTRNSDLERDNQSIRYVADEGAARLLQLGADLARSVQELQSVRDERDRLVTELTKSLKEADVTINEQRARIEEMQSRMAEEEQKNDAALRAAEDREVRLREEVTETATEKELLQLQVEQLSSEREALRNSLADSESQALQCEGDLARIRETLAEEQAAALRMGQENTRLAVLETGAGEQVRGLAALTEMMNMLRACSTAEEAVSVIVQEIAGLFPDHPGALYLAGRGQDNLERASEWGGADFGASSFAPDDCFALRRNCVHRVRDGRAALACRHAANAGPYVCVPLFAGRNILGVLHLSEWAPAGTAEAQQSWATTVAECVVMALSSFLSREKGTR